MKCGDVGVPDQTAATPMDWCRATLGQIARVHWAFVVLWIAGLALILTHLGSDYLWSDEGDTAVLGSNITKYGVPQAWDGVTFTDADLGARLNDNLVMVSHPWLQYYLAAGSFLVFGENTFSARLPFALIGWLTILVVYAFVWRASKNRSAAFCAAALLLLSVQFLLYARQCRNYTPNMLLNCLLIWIFLQMKSWRGCVLFAATAILLFHTHPLGIVPVAQLAGLTLIYKPFAAQRRWVWSAVPAIAIFTLPWLALAKRGYGENTEPVQSVATFLERILQYLIECASVTPLIGIIFLLIWWICCGRKTAVSKPKVFDGGETDLVLIATTTVLAYAAAISVLQSTYLLWLHGIRYTPAVLPLMAIVAGILLVKVSRNRPVVWVPLLLLFGFTKIVLLTPWIFWQGNIRPDRPDGSGQHLVAAHAPLKTIDSFVGTEQWLFWRDLWRENPGTVANTCQFLNTHARSGDRIITNFDWDPVYFHTRLPQAFKILPAYPIYEAARRKGLPDYVFDVDGARWVIWRPYWGDVNEYSWSEVRDRITSQGGRLTEVAQLEETVWENRENIHFRRFSGNTHLFAGFENAAPGAIFYVDWPNR